MSKDKRFHEGETGKSPDVPAVQIVGYHVDLQNIRIHKGFENNGAFKMIAFVKVKDIIFNQDHPRKTIKEESMEALAESIKIMGVLEPIMVHESDDSKIHLVAGERRVRAAKMARKKEIPAIFVKSMRKEEIIVNALIANMHRAQLTPLDEAEACGKLVSRFFFSKGEMALITGKTKKQINELLIINGLPDDVKKWCRFIDSRRKRPASAGTLLKAAKLHGTIEEKIAVLDKDYRNREARVKDLKEENLKILSFKL